MSTIYDALVDGTTVNAAWLQGLPDANGGIDGVGFRPYITANYIIFKIGSTYYRRNGATGIVDDSSANAATLIQNAETALAATTARGSIYLVPDTYALGATGLNIHSGIALYSSMYPHQHTCTMGTILTYTGAGYPITLVPASGTNIHGSTVTSCVNSLIQGIGIQGTSAGAGGICMGNGVDAVTTNRIRDCFIWDFTAAAAIGIKMNVGCINNQISNVRLFDNGIGMHLYGASSAGTNANQLSQIYTGIVDAPQAGIGIKIEGACDQNLIMSSCFESHTTGIYLSGEQSDKPHGTVFLNDWCEANTADVTIDANIDFTQFLGGSYTKTKITDNGKYTTWNVGYTTGTEIGMTLPKSAPGNPLATSTYFDSATRILYIYDGSSWYHVHLEA